MQDEKDALISQMKEQLAEKDGQYQRELATVKEQLAAKDEQIKELLKQLSNQNTRLQKSHSARNRRTKLPEPKRRKIAARQNWRCANPNGKCKLKDCDLEEYDVDHIVALALGGADDESNMQALCPACHRKKTETDQHQVRPVEETELS